MYNQFSFKEELLKRLTDEIERESARVCGGYCEDFSAYKDAIGYLRGMQIAVTLIGDVVSDLSRS